MDTLSAGSPLAGLRVVELGDGLSTAFCGRILAALGAEVVRYEVAGETTSLGAWPVSPSGASYLHAYLNQGKTVRDARSDSEGSLADGADIVLTSSLSIDALVASVAPATIVVQITPWGETGIMAGLPGSDLVEQAAAGVVTLVGRAGRSPLALGGHQAAFSAALQAFTGLMVALTVRDRTGAGQIVRTSHFEAMAALEWKGPVYYQADGQLLRRGAAGGPLVLPTTDGHVAFYYRPTDWPEIVELFADDRLRDERFADQKGRLRHEAEVFAIMSEHSSIRTKAELYEAAQARSIPVGAVETMADVLVSDQLRGRDFFGPLGDDRFGAAEAPALPFTFDGRRFTPSAAASSAEVTHA